VVYQRGYTNFAIDAHLSLRRVSSKIKTNAASGGTPKGTEYDVGGTVAGIGIAFGF